jgi:uncharacterized membrane protein
MTYSHKHNWLVLVLIMLAGVLIRQFFILRHKGKLNLAYPSVAVAVLAGVVAWLSPSALPSAPLQAGGAPATDVVELAQVQKIMQERCVQCHAAQPSLMPTPAKGIMLDSPESVRSHAQQIYQQVVVQKAMPLGNATKITDEERSTIAKWFETGAK